MKQFTRVQNAVLSEIYRRLNFFHNGDLNQKLLYLAFPSEARKIKRFGIIVPFGEEAPRVLNWYSLTAKGKAFFGNYIITVDATRNLKMFKGEYVKEFDSKLLCNLNDKLDAVEFYDLMQAYRLASPNDQDKVVRRFEAVKSWIRDNLQSITK